MMSSADFQPSPPDITHSLSKISQAHDKGTLYRKKVVGGELQSRKGFNLLGAYLGHAIKWVFSDIKKENDHLMEKMFTSCQTYFDKVEQKKTEPDQETPERTEPPSVKQPTAFDVKMAEKILGKLQPKTGEKVGNYKKISETLKAQKAAIEANAAPEIAQLIQDPAWSEIGSTKEIAALRTKLSKPYPKPLSEKEKVLLKNCLLLNEKCVQARNVMELDSTQTGWISERELNAIQSLSEQFANQTLKAHHQLEKELGPIDNPPSGKQVQAALKLAKKELLLYREVSKDSPELEKIYSRAFQLILYGPEGMAKSVEPDGNYLKLLEDAEAVIGTRIAENCTKKRETIERYPELNSLYKAAALTLLQDATQTKTTLDGIEPFLLTKVQPEILSAAVSLNRTLEKKVGPVAIENLTPIATVAQLKEAFTLANQHFPLLMSNRSDPVKRELAGKVIQHILCGNSVVKPAKNDYSFVIKELKERQTQAAVPLHLQAGETFLSYHVNTQFQAVTDTLNEFFGDKNSIRNVFPENIELLQLIKEPTDWDEFRRVLSEQANKINDSSEAKLSIVTWIDYAQEKDLQNLQTQIRQKSIKKYLQNFLKDVVERRESVSLNRIVYNIVNENDTKNFFNSYRDLYFKRLLTNPDLIQSTIDSNLKHEKTAAIPHDLDQNTFLSWLQNPNVNSGLIVQATTFTEEQLNQLSTASGITQEEIEPLLRIKALQMMMTTNQSVQGMSTQHINKSTPMKSQLMGSTTTPPLYYRSDASERLITISSDLEGFSASLPNHLYVLYNSGTIPLPQEYANFTFDVAKNEELFSVPSLTASGDEPHEVGRLAEYQDFGVGPDLINHLDALVEVVSSSKKTPNET